MELGSLPDRGPLLRMFCAIAGYMPHAGQIKDHLVHSTQAVADEKAQNKLILGGYGAGKTYWQMAETTMAAIASPGGQHLVTSPSHDQVQHVLLPVYRLFVETMAENGYPIERQWKEAKAISELHCGGRIFFRQFRKLDNLMGFKYVSICADEIELMRGSARAFNKLRSRARQMKGSRGQTVHWRQIHAGSTPDGMDGKVVGLIHAKRARAMGKPPEERRQHLLRWYYARRTGYENPHLPKGYMEDQKEGMSKRMWEQEGLGKILRPLSTVWPEYDPARHLTPRGYDPALPWDLSYDAGDSWPHVLWIQRHPGDVDVVFGELCPDGWPIDKLHAEILRMCKRLRGRPGLVVCDRAVKRERRWLQDAFPKSNVRWMESRREQSVNEGIEVVRTRLDPLDGTPKLLFGSHLRDTDSPRKILNCVRNYRFKTTSDGIGRVAHKDNIHDHGTDTLRMHQVAAHASDVRIGMVSRIYA